MNDGNYNSTGATLKPERTVQDLAQLFAKLSISQTSTSLIRCDKTNTENDNACTTLQPDSTVQVLVELFAKLSLRSQRLISRLSQSANVGNTGASSWSRLTIFEPFCRFPPEIKDLVFDYALATPHVIFIEPHSSQSGPFPKIFEATSYDVPLLRTCHQSRNRALWHYKCLSVPLARPVLINPKLDVLFFDPRRATPDSDFDFLWGYCPVAYVLDLFIWEFYVENFLVSDVEAWWSVILPSYVIRNLAIRVSTISTDISPDSLSVAGVLIPGSVESLSTTLHRAASMLKILDEIILIVSEGDTAGRKQLEIMPFHEHWEILFRERTLDWLKKNYKYPKITLLTQAEFDARMS